MRVSNPRELGAVLTTVLTELGIGQRVKQMKVLDIWADVVGKRIADATVPERINAGKLVVRVYRAPWRNELIFLKKDIIAKLNKTIGEEVVKDIIFR
jgi:predicted nucleic acid-binding Zn ribbon protein